MNYFYVNGIPDAGTKLGIAGFDADSKSKNPGTPEFNVSGFTGWGNSGTNWFQTRPYLASFGTDQLDIEKSQHHGRRGISKAVYVAERRQ